MFGPTLGISQAMHAMKYRGKGESFKEGMNRVASALTTGPEDFHAFRDVLLAMRFMPAGRVQNAMGSTKTVTPYNCFVSGTIEDSFVRGEGSIMARAGHAAETMRMGGGIGYDFSPLRPRGALIRKLESEASGPVSFMRIYNEVGTVTSSSGHRRGAEMAVLRVDHPDIEEFVRCKQPPPEAEPILEMLEQHPEGSEEWKRWHNVLQSVLRLSGFNISVGATDAFMECVRDGRPFPLVFERQTYREIDAGALWEMIMRSTWDWSEPGILFVDVINAWNNLWYCEVIAATNPCAEQPLPPNGACLLGSFNLVKYLFEVAAGWAFNWDLFRSDIRIVVAAMDNVVDRAAYPLYEQEKEAKSKRRMGLGITGLANCLEAMGAPYGSDDFLRLEAEVLTVLRDEAYRTSATLAEVRGPFPMYDEERYLEGKFIKTLPPDVRDLIAQNGIRNSHLLSIAPTGTISLCADNVSSGIEPVFAYEYDRTVQTFDGPETFKVPDFGVKELDVRGKITRDVTTREHLEVLKVAYRFVDSAVSKTCNVPPDTPWDEFKGLYFEAWEAGCKGIATHQMGGKRAGVLVENGEERPEAEPLEACLVDPGTGRKDCD